MVFAIEGIVLKGTCWQYFQDCVVSRHKRVLSPIHVRIFLLKHTQFWVRFEVTMYDQSSVVSPTN